MTFLFKLAHRIAKLRVAGVVLLAAACSKGEKTDFLSPNPSSNLPVLSILRVEPQINSVQVGSEIQFTATGYSTNGLIIPVNVDWTATGGIITPDGRYTGVLTGTFTVKAVSREKPSVADSARIGVWETGDELVALVVSPDSAVIDEGESVEFTAALRMARGALTGSAAVNWSSSGGDMTTGGRFTAAEPGEYMISALSVNNLRGSARVFVRKKSLQLTQIRSNPRTAVMKPNRDTTFTAQAVWANGSVTAASVDWSSTGGTINGAGTYRSGGATGAYSVIATDRNTGLADTSSVSINPPGVTRVAVSPKSLSMTAGSFQQFVAQAQLEDGSWTALQAIWEATSGQVTQAGAFTAPTTPGTYRVISTAPASALTGGSAGAAVVPPADTAVVTVVQPVATLTQVILNPSSVVIEAGGTRTFSVTGVWSDGSNSTPAVTWTASGGTIDASGHYAAGQAAGTFRVIATAGNGMADTSAVTIAAAVPVRLDLTPPTATINGGASQQFAVSATWSDGGVTVPSVAYAATGGTISSAGLYVAGTTTGTFSVIASMPGSGLADTSLVTINSPPPTLTGVLLTPTSVVLAPGASQQFTAAGVYSNGTTGSIGISWSQTGGSINSSGLYTAGSTPGTYRVIARQSGATRADTSVVTITSPPTLTSLSISPKPASMQTGATQQFSATAGWSDGSATVPPLVWTATGGSVGNNGLYTAGPTAGTFRVVATHQGGTKSDTSVVTLTPPPSAAATLVSLTISPKPTSLQTGTTRQFSVSAAWSDGSTTVPTLSWTATGGSITAGGLYTAGATAGSYRAIASAAGKADTAQITVTAPAAATLMFLAISPKPVTVQTGTTQQFTASALWSDGSTALPTVTWSATGGSITAGGLYTAGGSTGTFRAIASGGGRADTSVVTVSSAPPAPTSGTCASPGSGWIWCDDFETNRLASYFEYDNNGGDFAPAAGVGVGGSTGMRVRWQPGEVNAGNLKVAFGSTPSSYFRTVDGGSANYRDIYWRVYVKHQAGWTGGGADKLSRAIVFAGSNWAEAMIGHTWSGGAGNNYLVIDPASGTSGTGTLMTTGYNDNANLRWLGSAQSGTPIFDDAHVGQWYCIESHAKLNSSGASDGVFEVWINDALEAQRTGLNWVGNYSAYGINAVFFENYWNLGSPVAQERYFDNIVVSTQRIGCGAGSSAPATPTVTSFSLTPSSATVQTGATQQFQTSTTWSDGVSRASTISYSATGGSITVGGLFTAGTVAGTFSVIASCSCGKADTSAIAISTVAPATLTTLAINPKSVALSPGASRQFGASALWSNGSTTLPAVTYTAIGGSVTAGGFYTAPTTAGSYKLVVSTTAGSARDTSLITVTPPVSGGDPAPGAGARVWLDTRRGGANDIQAASVNSLSALAAAWNVGSPFTYFSSNIGFTSDLDGSGTHAIRSEMSGWGGSAQDGGSMIQYYLPNGTKPTQLYIQWKHRMGRTATGGGIGALGFFDITNQDDPGGNAGRKYLLLLRDVADGGNNGRVDHVWPGPSPVGARTEGFYGLPNNPGDLGLNLSPFDPEAHINETIVFTMYVQVSSSASAADGIVRVWYNGVLRSEHTGLSISNEGIHRFQFPTTMRSPIADMTEYFWDIVAWSP